MITRLNPSRLSAVLGLAATIAAWMLVWASSANAQVTYTALYRFAGQPTEGANPFAGLIQGPDGTLYGTTYYGGSGSCLLGCGTVFRLAPDGTGFTVLHNFTGYPIDEARILSPA